MTARTVTLARPLLGATLPFALPIGLSAFLLFSVEPLVGRLVLPIFGGTPAVWATVLFFFQGVLLVGYLYGHLSVTRLGIWGPPLHLALASLAVLSLLVAPVRIADLRVEAVPPVLDLIRILFVVIGLPALVLTTTTPLVSGWFETARERHAGGDPYWLYALSNGGSLLALLAYPVLIEPRLGLGAQRGIWAVGYVLLVVLLAVAASRAVPAIRARLATLATAAIAAPATPMPTVPLRPVRSRRPRSTGAVADAGSCWLPFHRDSCPPSRRSSPRISCRLRCCGSCRCRSTSFRSSSLSLRAAIVGSGVRRSPRRR